MIRRTFTVIGFVGAEGVLVTVISVAVLFLDPPQPRETEWWSLGPSMSAPRGELTAAVAFAGPCPSAACPELERLFAIGGLTGLGTVEDSVDILSPIENRWETGPALPEARHHLAAVGVGQTVYVSGGAAEITGEWAPSRDFWRLVWGEQEWQALEPMPEPRMGHRMVAYRGRIYVIGGDGPSSRVLIFTPREGWSIGSEMPVQRDHLSVVVVGSRIWAIGGRAPESLARVDIYDPEADSWSPGPSLPQATSGAAEGAIGSTILVFGGEEPALFGQVKDVHWQLNSGASSPIWEPAPSPPLTVHGAPAVCFNDAITIVGGASRHGLFSVTAWSDAVQRLDPEHMPC